MSILGSVGRGTDPVLNRHESAGEASEKEIGMPITGKAPLGADARARIAGRLSLRNPIQVAKDKRAVKQAVSHVPKRFDRGCDEALAHEAPTQTLRGEGLRPSPDWIRIQAEKLLSEKRKSGDAAGKIDQNALESELSRLWGVEVGVMKGVGTFKNWSDSLKHNPKYLNPKSGTLLNPKFNPLSDPKCTDAIYAWANKITHEKERFSFKEEKINVNEFSENIYYHICSDFCHGNRIGKNLDQKLNEAIAAGTGGESLAAQPVAHQKKEYTIAAKWVLSCSGTFEELDEPQKQDRTKHLAEVIQEAVEKKTDLTSIDHLNQLHGQLGIETSHAFRMPLPGASMLPSSAAGQRVMNDTMKKLHQNKDSISNIEKSKLLLGIVIGAHGYIDGNGRTGRAAYAIQRMQGGQFEPISPEETKEISGVEANR